MKLEFTIKGLLSFWFDALALGAIIVLIANFSVINWNWNPVVDFLYARTYGPEFYLNHYVSGVAVCATMLYFALKTGKPFKSLIVILATVPIHEITYEILAVQSISRPYVYEMAVYLVLGVIIANKEQRLKLNRIAIVTIIFCTFWGLYLFLSGHSSFTIMANASGHFIPGPMYYDPVDNIIEIISWLIPISMWYWFNPRSNLNKVHSEFGVRAKENETEAERKHSHFAKSCFTRIHSRS